MIGWAGMLSIKPLGEIYQNVSMILWLYRVKSTGGTWPFPAAEMKTHYLCQWNYTRAEVKMDNRRAWKHVLIFMPSMKYVIYIYTQDLFLYTCAASLYNEWSPDPRVKLPGLFQFSLGWWIEHNPGVKTDRWYPVKTQGFVNIFYRTIKQCTGMEKVILFSIKKHLSNILSCDHRKWLFGYQYPIAKMTILDRTRSFWVLTLILD